jgi:hypothetical protein
MDKALVYTLLDSSTSIEQPMDIPSSSLPTLELSTKHSCVIARKPKNALEPAHLEFFENHIYFFLLWKNFIQLIQSKKSFCYTITKEHSTPYVIHARSQALAQYLPMTLQLLTSNPCQGRDALYCHDVAHASQTILNHPQHLKWLEAFDDSMPHEQPSVQQVKIFEKIIKTIRKSFRSAAYLRHQKKEQIEYQHQLAEYSAYISDLFRPTKQRSERRRLLVIRVDLGFKKAILSKYDLEVFLKMLNDFFNQYHRNPLFKHLEGYIRKVEFGLEKGWHSHLLLFFNADHLLSSFIKAQRIGLAWNQLVESSSQGKILGVFNNCHHHKNRYIYRCIGKFDNYDAFELRQRLDNLNKYLLPYLLKRSGRVRFADQPKQKLITRSQLPAIIKQRIAAHAAIAALMDEIPQRSRLSGFA